MMWPWKMGEWLWIGNSHMQQLLLDSHAPTMMAPQAYWLTRTEEWKFLSYSGYSGYLARAITKLAARIFQTKRGINLRMEPREMYIYLVVGNS